MQQQECFRKSKKVQCELKRRMVTDEDGEESRGQHMEGLMKSQNISLFAMNGPQRGTMINVVFEEDSLELWLPRGRSKGEKLVEGRGRTEGKCFHVRVGPLSRRKRSSGK